MTALNLNMMSSGFMKIHLVTAFGFGISPSQAYPCSTNFFTRVSIGASIIKDAYEGLFRTLFTVDFWDSVYLRFLFDIKKPKYFTFSDSKWEILVFSSLSTSFRFLFRNSFIFSLILFAKLSEPLIPTTQSSAYLL